MSKYVVYSPSLNGYSRKLFANSTPKLESAQQFASLESACDRAQEHIRVSLQHPTWMPHATDWTVLEVTLSSAPVANLPDFQSAVKDWIAERDQERQAVQESAQRRRELREEALAKLTPEDRAALGILE